MEFKEEEKIFKDFQEYVEIASKLEKIFSVTPESFLPYSKEILEKALNIVAKKYLMYGNKKAYDTIGSNMVLFLFTSRKDEEALELMRKELNLRLDNPELKKATIESLKEAHKDWLKFKNYKHDDIK